MNHYQVLFSGEIAEGAQEDTVRENLARELEIDARKAGQLFSGRTVVIRSRLSQQDALTLQARFSDLGAVCRIKDLTPKVEEKKLDYRVDRQDRGIEQTLRDITAAHVECPRCGHLQLEASHCARCGVDIAAAISAQRREDLIIEKKIRDLRVGKTTTSPDNVRKFQTATDLSETSEQDDSKGAKMKAWFKKTS